MLDQTTQLTTYPSAPNLGEQLLDYTAVSTADVPSKPRVLFIPASIRSHIIPTLYLAELLAGEYDIFYAVTNPVLADIVTENGYTPVLNTPWRIAIGMEAQYLAAQQQPAGFWSSLWAMRKNAVYHHRKQELDELLAQVKPAAVIIDIFSSTDFLALYHHRTTVRLLFCNPMPSTYRVGNFPIVSESTWLPTPPVTKPVTSDFWHLLRNPKATLYQAAQRYQLLELKRLTGLVAAHALVNTPFTRLFANVPELILMPLELEMALEVRQPQQHYLGLSIRETRTDTELDADFVRQWPGLIEQQQAGQRLIYCSFGTFYTGSNKALLDFVTNLLIAIRAVPDVQLVCSVNSLVVETLQAQHAALSNVHFFRRVPQLTVLQHATVHITHGGLGSVKESIRYGVPMLVYPLDAHYDQPGNGLKVEYHGLGLRGDFQWERAANLQAKLLRLLDDATFRDNITRFQQTCAVRYTKDSVKDVLFNLL